MDNESQLAAALVKVQAGLKAARKDSDNPYFKSKYADLNAVWDAARKLLTDNGLCVIQSPVVVDGVAGLRTKLLHVSGESEESFLPFLLPDKPTAQSQGSAITYARRYAFSAMVGVCADEDDDGNAASFQQPKRNFADIAQKAFLSAESVEELDYFVKQHKDELSQSSHRTTLTKLYNARKKELSPQEEPAHA